MTSGDGWRPRFGAAVALVGLTLVHPAAAQERPPRVDARPAESEQPASPDAVAPAARPIDLPTPSPAETPADGGPADTDTDTDTEAQAGSPAGDGAATVPGPGADPAEPQSGNDATEATPGDGTGAPAEPAGPPAHTQLREDDFAFAACRLALRGLGTVYTVDPPVTGEQPDCGIDRPLTVTEILPGVTLEGGAAMRCDTARALAWWMRDFVVPAASRLPGAPRPVSLALGSTYECRATVGASTSKLSEHALGNAIDIAQFTLDDGTVLPVAGTEVSNAGQAFLLAVRWAACMDFSTVLGPGSNAAHDNHLHLDVKARRGGYRVCE